MTEHLGDRVSPLIDHQLDHDARDRALAHLAGCARCQAEVAELRQVKGLLVAMEDPAMSGALVARLRGIGAESESESPARAGRHGRADGGTRAGSGRAMAVSGPSPGGSGAFRTASRSELTPASGRSRPGFAEPTAAPGGRRPSAARLRGAARSRPGGSPRGPRAGSARPPTPGWHGVGPSPDGARGRPRRPSGPRRLPVPRSSVRRTLLGSAALLMLAVTGAAMTDNGGNARPGGSVAVPTVSSVVAPGQPAGGSLRLIPMFTPVRVSLRR